MGERTLPQMRRLNHTGFNWYLAEHRLMAARCIHCGEFYLPPRALCPGCYRSDMEWVELSGEGRLEGFTVIYLGLKAMAAAGYNRQNPYCSGVVRLPEGPAITAQILIAGHAPLTINVLPAAIRVGAPVRAVFLDRAGSDQVALAFEVIS